MKEFSKDKIIKTETVFHKIDYDKPITFGEILEGMETELQPDDVILQNWEDEYHGSDSAMDGHYSIEIFRDRLETDEEYQKRIADGKLENRRMRKRRYEHYLKLKTEFENEQEK